VSASATASRSPPPRTRPLPDPHPPKLTIPPAASAPPSRRGRSNRTDRVLRRPVIPCAPDSEELGRWFRERWAGNIRFELACQLFRTASGMDQLDHLTPQLRWIRWVRLRHREHLLPQWFGVHATGSSPKVNFTCASPDPPLPALWRAGGAGAILPTEIDASNRPATTLCRSKWDSNPVCLDGWTSGFLRVSGMRRAARRWWTAAPA
jgi:hypothetical protein